MDPMFQIIAVFCTGTFFGVAIYLSLVQHPAAMSTGIDFAGRFFGPMYLKAAPLQVLLAVLGSFAGLFEWLLGSGIMWLIGGLCLFAVIPYTLMVIKPINDKLLPGKLSTEETEALLKRWAQLHWVRSILSGAAFLIFLLVSHW